MSARLTRIGAVVRKEWGQIRRDPSSFGIAFILPLLLLLIFGSGISLDTGGTRTALVMQDNGAAAQRLASDFAASPSFRIIPAASVEAARRALVSGDVRAILVIPQDFSRAVASAGTSGRAPQVQIITDGSIPNTARFVTSHARGVLASWAGRHQAAMARGIGPGGHSDAAPPLRLEPHYMYNAGLKSRNFLVPGAIAIVMAMIGSLLTALVVAREWERATMAAIMATPLTPGEFMIGKAIPYAALGMASMGLCVLVALGVYGLPFAGSLLALAALGAAFLFAVMGQGLLISSAAKSQFVSTQYALLSGFMPSLMLSGFLFEIAAMPTALQWLSWIVPARYLIPPLESLFLAGNIWPLFWPNLAALTGFGLFFFWRATALTARSLS